MKIRWLDPEHLDAAFDIRTRSFGVLPEAAEARWKLMMRRAIEERLALACYDDDQLAAVARINRYEQWWLGRSVPMAGIAGVVVSPEYRGQGVGRTLMLGVLKLATAHRFAISALYPATAPLYRGCGWEMAGSQHLFTVPAEALRTLPAPRVPLRRVGPADAEEILSVVRRVHTGNRSSGPINWDPSGVAGWLGSSQPFAYLAEDGFLTYQWSPERDLAVDELVAGSTATALALWSMVGSGSSIATTVRACISPDDPLRWLLREPVIKPDKELPWMLRLLDLPAALEARGYPPGVDTEFLLVVDDPQLPDNSGTWRLTVAKGTGRVTRVAADPATTGESSAPEADPDDTSDASAAVRLGPRGLAALYVGTPLPALRTAGLISGGDPETDALLDTVFTARPYLLDYF